MTVSAPPLSRQTTVVPGIERLLKADLGLIAGQRVGLVCNPASVDSAFQHSADLLAASRECTLAAIFGPQHGFRSDVQDNMIETPHVRDAQGAAGGFGLHIVEAIAVDWGWRPTPDGKVVWADVSL